MNRPVTERDLRMPEFADANPEDLEFREDGKIVRKDRWETGFRSVAALLFDLGLLEFKKGIEIEEVVDKLEGILPRAIVMEKPVENDDHLNVIAGTHGPWSWARLANNEVLLTTFPAGTTYEVLEGEFPK